MPYFNYTIESKDYFISYYWEKANGGREFATTTCMDDANKGQTSSTSRYKTKYEMLPRSLKSCLDYCALLYNIQKNMEKEILVRQIVAEGVIEKRDAEDASSLEDIASSMIDELVGLGMLISQFSTFVFITCIEVPEACEKLCIVKGNKDDFVTRSSHSPIHLFLRLHDDDGISHYLKNLPIQSLFLYTFSLKQLSHDTINTICGLQTLFVLDLHAEVSDIIKNKVRELVNLRFLSWKSVWSTKIPPGLGNLQHLQTLQFSGTFDEGLEEVVNIKSLRHIQTSFYSFFRLPKGMGTLVNLQTLDGWKSTPDTVGELSSLTQLRHLKVYDVGENMIELLGTIASMKNLVSLFMAAEFFPGPDKIFQIFPLLEPFSPPTLLEYLHLHGTLMELPNWFSCLKNLTCLVLFNSSLAENPSTILQFLPKLKYLCLDSAYNPKLIGKDFCAAGGFPKLEFLEIRSDVLVEWTEILVGAFPSLVTLQCSSSSLLFFPESVRNISTLHELRIAAHEDLIRRLKGDENYKIKHIPKVIISSCDNE